ncbi:MAG: SDR family oxidoreductase [Candidatus Eremiobacteraeota bacterium]|nr:SDR family oxidoreductase [Candidatus Eremiobacteraeota bacterium]
MNKIAIVTGAGSGIGRACAIALAEAGFTTILAGRRRAPLEETAALAPAGSTLVVPADVREPASVDALFATAKERFGRVDLLFNNAGLFAPPARFEDLTKEQWDEIVAVNVTGAFLCAQAAFRTMKEQNPQGGRIINNGSIAAHAPRPLGAPYTTTKHAITGLTKSISLDGRPYTIACGQIDIGNAQTAMMDRIEDAAFVAHSARQQSGFLQADGTKRVEPMMDVKYAADAVVFMAQLPLDTNVQFLTVMATNMPYVGRG